MKVIPIPCLSDNYAYLIICETTNQAGIVDPSEFAPVWKVIQSSNVQLVAILNTHHHWDHVGGNEELLEKISDLKIYGHDSDKGRIPGQNNFLTESDTVTIGELNGTITHNPGHTTGAITYYFEDSMFTGDTMFAAGCGRIFEGSPQQMYQSLNQTMLPHASSTKVYFGHEYTENNLKFALSIEPQNQKISERLEQVRQLRQSGQFTTPSTLAAEIETNPFLRCDSPELQKSIRQHEPSNDLTPTSVFRVVRQLKDSF